MNAMLPPAGIRNGKRCDCACHSVPGITHFSPCCQQQARPRGPNLVMGRKLDTGIVRPLGADGESLLDSPWLPKIGMVVAGYHGVRRNNGSLFWGAVWAIAGRFAPIAVSGLAVAQGYAAPKPRC